MSQPEQCTKRGPINIYKRNRVRRRIRIAEESLYIFIGKLLRNFRSKLYLLTINIARRSKNLFRTCG